MKRAISVVAALAVLAVFASQARAFSLSQDRQNLIMGGGTICGLAGGITLITGDSATALSAGAGSATWVLKELFDWRMGRETSLSEFFYNAVYGAYWGAGINSINGDGEVVWACLAGVGSGGLDELWENA